MDRLTVNKLIKKYEEILKDGRRYCNDYDKLNLIENFIKDLKKCEKNTETTKVLFVEDGSIDVDSEKEALEQLGYKVVVCRQGANMPMVLEVNRG